VRNAGPAILGRGVVQLSAYVDMVLASLLAIGAVARMRYAQTLYVLPLSLFAMSIAAAELPELARDRDRALGALRERAIAAVSRASFYVVPSFIAFVVLGHIFVAGIYRAGVFTAADVNVVWLTLIAYSAGLLASTSARIYQSAFFALRDTKTTARIAALRVLTSALAGTALMTQFEPLTIGTFTMSAGLLADVRMSGVPLGPVGLALGASVGAWLEWALLRRSLTHRIGSVGAGGGHFPRTFAAALLAAAAGYGVNFLFHGVHPLPTAALVAAAFGIVYFTTAHLFGLQEARAFTAAVSRRLGRRS
jgi:putative peptidoglycan lipid II flippase